MPYKDREAQLRFQRQHYQTNKEAYQKRFKSRRRAKVLLVLKIKAASSCVVCGEKHPACLDFHHKPGTNKIADVSTMVREYWKDEEILAEIDKCEVICSNCHRKHHWSHILEMSEQPMPTSERIEAEAVPCVVCGSLDNYVAGHGLCEVHWKQHKEEQRKTKEQKRRRGKMIEARRESAA